MSHTSTLISNDFLYQLGGVTGVGWTASLLGYLWALTEPGDTVGGAVAVDPQTLLVLSVVLLTLTLGLDRLQTTGSEG